MNTEHLRFYIYANSGGCPQNQLDGAHLIFYLEGNGYIWTSRPERADLIIINGCAYNSLKEAQSVDMLMKLSHIAKRSATIIASGCLPRIAPQRIESLNEDFFIIPAVELNRMEDYVPPKQVTWDNSEANHIPAPLFDYVKPFRRYLSRGLCFLRKNFSRKQHRHFDRLFMYDHSPETFLVRIAEGCIGNCTYCAIRLSRGRLFSKPLKTIVEEIRQGLRSGEDEILLTATELAAYGRDISTNLAELLAEILSLPGDFDLLLFYANPRWLIDIWDRLEPIFATGRIHFLHLSLNGGSDNVLHLMQRGYSLNDFESLVHSLRQASPGIVLQTQVIVGFPGESEDDFIQTLSFFRQNYLNNVQVHVFDPRPRTPAIEMRGHVPPSIKQQRRKILYRQTLLSKLRFDFEYILNGFDPPEWSKG